MYWQNPEMLWLLILVPIAAVLCLAAYRRRRQLRRSWGDERLISPHSSRLSFGAYLLRASLVAGGVLFLVLALARPTVQDGRTELPQGTTDVIVMVDVSRSMASLDYKNRIPSDSPFADGTRLDMARYLIMDKVVPELGANRLGIVTYAGEAFPLAFLTRDVPAVDWVHRRAMLINSAPGNGSALVKAFLLSFQLFDLDSDPAHKKIIVLFSDGGNDDGLETLNAVTRELSSRGITLIVVGLGRNSPSAIPVKQLSHADRQRFYGREFYELNGEVVTTQLDENALRLLANRSGGRYVRVSDAGDFSFSLFAQRLEMIRVAGREELFIYPLALGMLLLILGWFSTSEFASRFGGRR
ncbi:MAG: VWA domain-containing protein [Candidatus Obscuribacterales bacterium]|nr:VWA domain-containing protein [Candidatus Obscuribacterales bacterium]